MKTMKVYIYSEDNVPHLSSVPEGHEYKEVQDGALTKIQTLKHRENTPLTSAHGHIIIFLVSQRGTAQI